jgi:hypothetical protein
VVAVGHGDVAAALTVRVVMAGVFDVGARHECFSMRLVTVCVLAPRADGHAIEEPPWVPRLTR